MTYGPEPQERVAPAAAAMLHTWRTMTFIHWRYDSEVVQRLVPGHLVVETFDGSAWVGLTPFVLANVRAPGALPVPWISSTPETNVRTYVVGPDGRRGIWFFSLDIGCLPAAAVGRSTYVLPYLWSDMAVDERTDVIRYTGHRRWPQRPGHYDITVHPGESYSDNELSELDHFLTALWVVHMHYGPVPAFIRAEHQRWPLARADIAELEQDVLQSGGLPAPSGEPLAHFSTGVDVRISVPHLARGAG
ncbi:MAG TPA: DUF2071 domain-containing protein [Acidimicrobiales bacterium]|jgi:hypothetical protein